jgi:hypothetical protein
MMEKRLTGNATPLGQRHGRGVFGQRVAPHTNGTASPFFHQDRTNVTTAGFQRSTISSVIACERALRPRRARTDDINEIQIVRSHKVAKSSRCLGS